jgi:uncharacterized membrane protein
VRDEAVRAAAHDPGVESRHTPVVQPKEEPLSVGALLAGGALLFLGLRRRGAVGGLAALTGAGIVANALRPVVRKSVVRRGTARRTVDLESSMIVERPVRDAFTFCSNFENFPRLVHALDRVIDYGDGRSRWTMRRSNGEVVEWDVIVTKFVPNQVIAWESLPGAPVRSGGLVRFTPLVDARTRLDIRLVFAPRHTTVRDAWRALLAPPAARSVGEDLSRAGEHFEQWDRDFEPAPPAPMMPGDESDPG